MTTEQKLTSATKRHQEMTDCLERLKKLCEEERDCDHGYPPTHWPIEDVEVKENEQSNGQEEADGSSRDDP